MIGRLWQGYARSMVGLSREVWILSGVMLVNRMGSMVKPFLAIFLVTQRGFSPFQMGGFLALGGLGSMLGVQLGGWLTDRIGHFRVQVGSMVLAAPLFLALGVAESPAAIGTIMLLLSTASDAVRPANGAAIALYSPAEQRTRAFGLLRLAVNVGMTIGPAVGGVLAAIDYAWIFYVNAAMSWLAAGVLIACGRGWKTVGAQEREPRAEHANYSPWRDSRLLGVMLFLIIGVIPFFQFMGALPLYLKEIRLMSEAQIGALFAVNTVIIVALEMPLLQVLRRRPPLRMTALGCLFAGTGFALTPILPSMVWLVFTVCVWTLGEMLQAPAALAWVSKRGPDSTRGRTMGLFGLGFALASMMGPLFGTYLYEKVGPNAPWAGCLVLALVAFAGLSAVARAEEREKAALEAH